MSDHESNVNDMTVADLQDASPACPHCLTPFSEADYYCQNCGEAVGQLTGYIPFVNIRFIANFYGKLWRKGWYGKSAWFGTRLFCLVLVFAFAPIMLIGLPFVLWEYLQRRRSKSSD